MVRCIPCIGALFPDWVVVVVSPAITAHCRETNVFPLVMKRMFLFLGNVLLCSVAITMSSSQASSFDSLQGNLTSKTTEGLPGDQNHYSLGCNILVGATGFVEWCVLCNEFFQFYKEGFQDWIGSWWNVADIVGSISLLLSVAAHFLDQGNAPDERYRIFIGYLSLRYAHRLPYYLRASLNGRQLS